MTEILPDTIRRLYTDPAEYIDSDHPAVQQFARAAVPAGADAWTEGRVAFPAGSVRASALPGGEAAGEAGGFRGVSARGSSQMATAAIRDTAATVSRNRG